jgi:hypothetical protein
VIAPHSADRNRLALLRHGLKSQNLWGWHGLLSLLDVVVITAYIALGFFGGRFPRGLVLLPFIPVFLWGIPELVWVVRHRLFMPWPQRPRWIRLGHHLTGVAGALAMTAMMARYYLF